MPRKVTSESVDIQASRARWYKAHMERKQFVSTFASSERKRIARLIAHIQPQMNVYGGDDFTREQLHEIFAIAKGTGIDHWFLCWWFWSDEGLQEFERLWASLPEPVHIPLCTNRTSVHSSYTEKR